MSNDFVILGPAPDGLNLAQFENAGAALECIRTQGADFISRGDDSGTHKKEKHLWQAASITPDGAWYIEAGQGHLYTNRTARFLAHGTVWMARMLKEHGPIEVNLLKLTEEAQKVSIDTAPAG